MWDIIHEEMYIQRPKSTENLTKMRFFRSDASQLLCMMILELHFPDAVIVIIIIIIIIKSALTRRSPHA
jgi:hypothetical protein